MRRRNEEWRMRRKGPTPWTYSTEGAMRGGTCNLHPIHASCILSMHLASYPCILHPIHASYSKKQKEEEKKKKRKWKAGIMYDRIFSMIRFADKRVESVHYKLNMMLWEPSAAIQKEEMRRNRKWTTPTWGRSPRCS